MGEREGRSGRFEIVRLLGTGGMGVVHEARDLERGRAVALKTLSGVEADAVYRIKREFRALAGIRHPNLVDLYELGADEGRFFIAMELVEGVDFLAHCRPPRLEPAFEAPVRMPIEPEAVTEMEDPEVHVEDEATEAILPPSDGPATVDVPALRRALPQLVEGVCALHAAGRLHRDIKPSNVLVTPEGRVVILDFGLATEMWSSSILQSTREGGAVLGTIAYMSPEQAANASLTAASDWYAVGAILYQALSGHLPFSGAPLQVLLDKQRADPIPIERLAPWVPPDLAALTMRLLRRSAQERPRAADIREQVGLTAGGQTGPFEIELGKPPFVGRGEEMAALHAAYGEAAKGGGSTMLVEAPRGFGKSALVTQFLDEISAATPRPVILFGRCHEDERLPFKAVDAVIDALVRHLLREPEGRVGELFGPDARTLARLFPVMRRLPVFASARADTSLGPPAELRRRAFEALASALRGLAAHRPLVVVVEDLHFGDLDSARLFSHLLGPPHPVPMLLLGTSWLDDPTATRIAGQVRRSAELAGLPTHNIQLGALDPEASAQLAASILRASSPPEVRSDQIDAEARRVALEAGGDPVLVEELAGLGVNPEPTSSPVAERLPGLLAARVGELGSDERRALEVLAVATGAIPVSALAEAAGLEGAAAHSVPVSLREARLAAASGLDEEIIAIAGDRLRDAVLAHVDARLRSARHAALVRGLLAEESRVDPRVLVHHLRAAGDGQRAARVALTAAEEAFQALAFERAAELYQVCLELGDAGSVVEWSLLERLGDSLAFAGRGPVAGQAYLDAARVARPAQAIHLERKAAEQFLGAGHYDEGMAAARRVVAAAGLSWPKSRRAAIRAAGLARLQTRVRGLGFETRDPSDVVPELRLQVDVCWTVATGLALFDLPRSIYFVGRMLQIAQASGDLEGFVRALAAASLTAGSEAGSGGYARRLRSALREAAEAQGTVYAEALVLFSTGLTRYLRGRWADAENALDGALTLLAEQCQGVGWEIHTTRLMRLEALSWQGKLQELPLPLASARAVAEETGNLYALTTLRVCPRLAVLHLASDHPERLDREVTRALADWPERGFHVARLYALESLAMSELYRGEGEAAFARVEATWAPLERSGLFRVLIISFEAWSLRARVALAAGATDKSARKTLAGCLNALRRIEAPGAPGEVRLLRAQRAALRGRTDEAAELFDEAATRFEAAGQSLHAAVSRLGRSTCLSGRDAERLRTQATQALDRAGIRLPLRWARIIAPGLQSLLEPDSMPRRQSSKSGRSNV